MHIYLVERLLKSNIDGQLYILSTFNLEQIDTIFNVYIYMLGQTKINKSVLGRKGGGAWFNAQGQEGVVCMAQCTGHRRQT